MAWKTETIPLAHPIPAERCGRDAPITSVTFRDPDMEALEAVEDIGLVSGTPPKLRQIRSMIVAMSDLTEEEAKGLHRDDIPTLAEKLAPFMTGEEDAPVTSPSPEKTAT